MQDIIIPKVMCIRFGDEHFRTVATPYLIKLWTSSFRHPDRAALIYRS